MPQLQATADGLNPVKTVTSDNKIFKVRLRERYKANEYVRVINIDDTPVYWNYFPMDGEETYFTDDGAMRVVEGRQHFDEKRERLLPGNDQAWMIEPGESEVLLGDNADHFIEMLYKTLVAKKTIAKTHIEKGQARKFNWNDGNLMDEYIDKIFLGIVKPEFEDLSHEPIKTSKAIKQPASS